MTTTYEKNYVIILRLLGIPLSVAVWVIGFHFSVAGFEKLIGIPGNTAMGWTLGILVTYLQLIFNRGMRDNPTLFVFGLLAYVYGIGSNMMGLFSVQEFDYSWAMLLSAPLSFIGRGGITVIVALFIEAAPEAMLTYGLFGQSLVGDLVSSLFSGMNVKRSYKGSGVQKNTQNGLNSAPVHLNGRTAVHLNGVQPERTDSSERPGEQNGIYFHAIRWPDNPMHKKVVAAALNEYRRTGQQPSVRQVATLSGVSVGTAGEVTKKLWAGEFGQYKR